ncbi:MAG: AMP-binding protein [Deltaproteobacteria bacterium]|nr:AMP-binding protein [Deltaproteobacteria bacterium]
MTAPHDIERLLGTGRFDPPPDLRRGACFDDEASYLAFIEAAASDPDSFWMRMAGEIDWIDMPARAGGAPRWFPGGRLNLAATCLGRGAPADVLLSGVRSSSEWMTRGDLLGCVGALCEMLSAWSLPLGAPVLIAFPRGAEILPASLACLWRGWICVPVDPDRADPGRVSRRAQAAGCRAVLTSRSVVDAGHLPGDLPSPRLALSPDWTALRSEPPPAEAVDAMHPAFMLADSAGRLYSLPCAGFAVQALSSYRYLLDGRGEKDLHWLQMASHHASFLAGSLGAWLGGGRVVVPPGGDLQDLSAWLDAIGRTSPRVVVIQAGELEKLLMDGSGSAQRGPALIVLEGDAVSPGLYRQARDLFEGRTHVVQAISRPEGGGYLVGPQPGAVSVQPASAGLAAPGVGLIIVDEEGKTCPPGYGGRAALRRPLPGLAIELQEHEPPIQIGLHARVDPAGCVWSMGEGKVARTKARTPVATAELETMIASLDGVQQVAVVRHEAPGGPGRAWAFVQPAPDARLEAKHIGAQIADRFGREAVPESIQLVSQLPFSRTGKVLRSVLRRIASGDASGLGDLEVGDREVIQRLIGECQDENSG